MRSSAPWSLSCDDRLEIIPPGICHSSTAGSTAVKALSYARYFLRTSRKYSEISSSSLMSMPVARSVFASAATIDSVGGCDVPMDMDEMAQSRMSAPASTARR